MQWSEILKLLGGTTVLLAAIAWLVRTVVSHLLEVRLTEWKAAHETRLQELQCNAELRLENWKAALARMDHLESNLIQSRGEAYGEIWSLTGSISVFGATKAISAADLSAKLSHWYFAQGWLLTEDSKARCFLIQEVLNFYVLRSLSFHRPDAEQLFGTSAHTVDVLRALRKEQLGIEVRGDDGGYSVKELRDCVARWKSKRLMVTRDTTTPEEAWVLIQFLMSAFRTRLVEELKSRAVFAEPKPPRVADTSAVP